MMISDQTEPVWLEGDESSPATVYEWAAWARRELTTLHAQLHQADTKAKEQDKTLHEMNQALKGFEAFQKVAGATPKAYALGTRVYLDRDKKVIATVEGVHLSYWGLMYEVQWWGEGHMVHTAIRHPSTIAPVDPQPLELPVVNYDDSRLQRGS